MTDAYSKSAPRIAFVGFGEAAEAFRTGLGERAGAAAAFDVKLQDPQEAPALAERCRRAGVANHATLAAALEGAELVFCLVTADQALAAAHAAAPHLPPGALWLDGNSCSPGAKRAAAEAIEAAGGRYVDVAVMAPVHPTLHRTPLLLAGPEAERAAAILEALDMRPTVAGERVGDASSVKMLRSVMVKGLEAVSAECALAARRAGVERAVLASLDASDPGTNWEKRVAYNLERMMVHGVRRAAEMREVAATLRELGLPDRMASATAEWEAEIGALRLPGGDDDLLDRADRILARLS
jgi:3-hydroxyisobutyrate dehydrogenase-like beta-hydroxyacid dehydrogenase